MKHFRPGIVISLFAILLALLPAWIRAQQTEPPPASPDTVTTYPAQQRVFVVPIRGEISEVTRRSMERRVQEAIQSEADLIVFEMDTPGGLVVSALKMCNYIKLLPVRTLAWVNPDAYSAGAMIALACDNLVMAPRSKIGDAAPIVMGQSLSETERSKAQSPVLEEFRDSAQRNGYPVALAEAMVRLGPAIYMIRNPDTGERQFVQEDQLDRYGLSLSRPEHFEGGLATQPAEENAPALAWRIVKKVHPANELLTLTQTEAVEYGFADAIVAGEAGLVAYTNAADVQLTRIESNWSEDLAAWLSSPLIRGLLLVVFLLGFYSEMQTPGLGIAGGIALVAMALMIGAPYLSGLAEVYEILFIVAGIVLLLLEVFVIPGFGVAGISGLVLIFIGLILTFVPPDPGPGFMPTLPVTWHALQMGLLTVTLSFAIAMVGFALLTRFYGSIPFVSRLILTSEEPAPRLGQPVNNPTPTGELVTPGDVGVAVTGLRPVGRARIHEELIDVVTRGNWIEAGQAVRVVEVRGNRILVEEV